tara:strand:- start:553 stop:831 length:279 start_codon:yes stop_codon:yes gene_type:complete
MKIIIEHNNIRMVEIEIDKEIKKFKYQDPEYQNIQREYRKNYYQDNKNKISNYQKNYYYKKMGYDHRKILNWKGYRVKGLVINRGLFTVIFD